MRDLPFALLAKREQVAVDEIGMRRSKAVRQTRIVDPHGRDQGQGTRETASYRVRARS